MNCEHSGRNEFDDHQKLVKKIIHLSDCLNTSNFKAAMSILDQLIPICMELDFNRLRLPEIKLTDRKLYRELKHAKRVSIHARELAKALACTQEAIKDIEIGGFVHDVGKLIIDELVLYKKDRLSPQEWKTIQGHALSGGKLLSFSKQFARFIPIAEQHHERWDGSGYPKGIKGSKIHYSARLISIVDAFDAMTCNRSYHKCIPPLLAIEEIARCSATQFDPYMAEVFISQISTHQSYNEAFLEKPRIYKQSDG